MASGSSPSGSAKEGREPPTARPDTRQNASSKPVRIKAFTTRFSNVIPERWNILVAGHFGLITHLGEQSLGGVGVGREEE